MKMIVRGDSVKNLTDGTDISAIHLAFAEQYGSRYEKQMEHLRRRLTEWETGADHFVVIPIEAGLGKSLQTDRIIGEYIRDGGTRRFLLVKKFIDDVEASVQSINAIANSARVQSPLSPYVLSRACALGITKDNWRQYRDDMESVIEHQVVVITDQRYLNLCHDERLRNLFSERRHTLVIDEALPFPLAVFDDGSYRDVLGLLPVFLHAKFIDMCQGLFRERDERKVEQRKSGNKILLCRPQTDMEKLEEFRRDVEANLHNLTNRSGTEDVLTFIDTLFVLYQNECLYNGERIIGYDPGERRWRLTNNVILDANGSIDPQYRIDSHVQVDRQTLIVDHSRWSLTQIEFNASMANINRTPDYIPLVCREIHHEQEVQWARTLFVTQKRFVELFRRQLDELGDTDVEVAYFGYLIGRNDWRDHSRVWIVTTPNHRMETYPIRWAMAGGGSLEGRNLRMQAGKAESMRGKYTFHDVDFEQMRSGTILCEVYQAVKRINRDNSRDAAVYVVTKESTLVEVLSRQMRGIQVQPKIELSLLSSQSKQSLSHAERLEQHLIGLPAGTYAKRSLREAVELDASNFGRLLRDERIKRLIDTRTITVDARHITKHS